MYNDDVYVKGWKTWLKILVTRFFLLYMHKILKAIFFSVV